MATPKVKLDDDLAASFKLFPDTASHAYIVELQNNRLLNQLLEQGAKIMAGLQELKDAVAAEKTVNESAIKLLDGLAAKIAALAPDQAAIDELANEVKSQTAALAAAVEADSAAGQ